MSLRRIIVTIARMSSESDTPKILKRLLLPLFLATAALVLGASACGEASKGTKSTPGHSSNTTAASTDPSTNASGNKSHSEYTTIDGDKDNDVGAPYDDTNNNEMLDYGHAAAAADQRAVTALIKHYYAAAVAGEGAKACSMLVADLAKAVAEDYGRKSAGPSYLSSGTTCPVVMGLLFKHLHSQLATAVPQMQVTHVRLVGSHGLAVMSFGGLERQIPVIREGRTWKVEALLDSEAP